MKLTELLAKISLTKPIISGSYYTISYLLSDDQSHCHVFKTGVTAAEIPDVDLPDNIIMDRLSLVRGCMPQSFYTPHLWLGNIREMTRMLSSDIRIPHDDCDVCDEARGQQMSYLMEKIRQTNELGAKYNLAPTS